MQHFIGVLGATEGGSVLKSYWAGIFTAGYVNVSASIALSGACTAGEGV